MSRMPDLVGTQASAADVPGSAMESKLSSDAILTAEFQYIAQSLFQNNEDRSRVTSFYLLTLGSFIAAAFSSTQITTLDASKAYAVFAILFAVLALMSLLTILQLIRFREAWFESAAALNEIKRYYMKRLGDESLGEAFRWKPGQLGKKFKVWSVGFLLAFQVATLGGLCLGAFVIFAGLVISNRTVWLWSPAVLAAAAWDALQVILYRQLLTRSQTVQ